MRAHWRTSRRCAELLVASVLKMGGGRTLRLVASVGCSHSWPFEPGSRWSLLGQVMDSIAYQTSSGSPRRLGVPRGVMFAVAALVAVVLSAGVWWVGRQMNVIADPLAVPNGSFMRIARGSIDVVI